MKQRVIIFLVIAGGVIGFAGYCFAWIDWVQDVREGVYTRHQGEGVWETGALCTYSYFAIRFMLRRLHP